MKVSIGYRRKFEYFSKVSDLYEEKKYRSRTFVNGWKAVRIANNTKLYPDGKGGYFVRYYSTDILHYTPDGYVGVRTGSYFDSVKTKILIWQLSGVALFSKTNSLSAQEKRVHIEESRDGKAPFDIRSSIPFVEGLRVDCVTGEIHPDDIKKIPSDTRKMTPVTKDSKAKFRKLFDRIKDRIKFSIEFSWPEFILGQLNQTNYFVTFGFEYRSVTDLLQKMIDDHEYEPTEDELMSAFIYLSQNNLISIYGTPTRERIVGELKKGFSLFRKKLRDLYMSKYGTYDMNAPTKLGDGYYVSEGDEK